jgi:hypothetical protein
MGKAEGCTVSDDERRQVRSGGCANAHNLILDGSAIDFTCLDTVQERLPGSDQGVLVGPWFSRLV